jgi:TetR/AcrR family transcriptional repressor of mexJK operon
VIAEAERFPDLADSYFERGPLQALEALAAGFRRLDELGLLSVDDAESAATQYAYLVLGPLVDRALFQPRRRISRTQIGAQASASVATFLARYQAKISSRSMPSSPKVK